MKMLLVSYTGTNRDICEYKADEDIPGELYRDKQSVGGLEALGHSKE